MMFSLLRSRVSITTLLVFSVTILGLMSVQNMLLYNTVEHETFSQLTNVWKGDLAGNLAPGEVGFQSIPKLDSNLRGKDNLDPKQSSHDTLQIQRNSGNSDVSGNVLDQERMHVETRDETIDKNQNEIVDGEQVNVNQNGGTSVKFINEEHGERGLTEPKEDEEKGSLPVNERAGPETDVYPDQNNTEPVNNPDTNNAEADTGLNSADGSTLTRKIPERRKNLIIIGLSRSGTSYMCHMFNQDPNVFNIYEPMQMLTHWEETDHIKLNYKEVSSDMINGIMTCNYTANDYRRKFVKDFSTFWRYRFQSNAFSSEPFCKTPNVKESCVDMIPEVLENVCLDKYKHTVVKLTYSRLPEEGKIQTLIPILLNNPDIDIRILHFVRDPRGNFNSRIKLGWIGDYPNPILGNDAKKICGIVERNILYGKNLTGWVKEKYRVFRYVDMFTEPLKTAQEIYDFAGFEFPESVKEWIVKTTAPSEEEVERMRKNPMALVRNSRENVEKWKKDAPEGRIKLLEENCGNLIKLMGHKFVFPPKEETENS